MIFVWVFRVVAGVHYCASDDEINYFPSEELILLSASDVVSLNTEGFCFIQPEIVVSRVACSAYGAALCFIFVVSSFPWQF